MMVDGNGRNSSASSLGVVREVTLSALWHESQPGCACRSCQPTLPYTAHHALPSRVDASVTFPRCPRALRCLDKGLTHRSGWLILPTCFTGEGSAALKREGEKGDEY